MHRKGTWSGVAREPCERDEKSGEEKGMTFQTLTNNLNELDGEEYIIRAAPLADDDDENEELDEEDLGDLDEDDLDDEDDDDEDIGEEDDDLEEEEDDE